MKHLLTLLLSVSTLLSVSAQQLSPSIICGNDVYSRIVREKHPELDAAIHATFEDAKRAGHKEVRERSPLTIQVVVHMVWNEAEENLSDDIIADQIRVLNEDYNRQNADTSDLREEFHYIAGNADIHFELAQVVRVQTQSLFEIDVIGDDLLSDLKSDATGGSSAWDPEHYLNIWVCKIQPTTIFGLEIGQILGFAFPPTGLSHWPDGSSAPTPGEDGVVIDFRAFSSINPNPIDNPADGTPLLLKGRTPVHEVGHYLGLRHIWGDGGLFGPNDCAQSDGVDDTPFASAQSEFDCNKSRNSCDLVELFFNEDPLDLVENYMDYSSEECMNMFTKGQVEIMRGVLTGPRAGLLNSVGTHQPASVLGCSLSPNPAQDRAVLRFNLPEAGDVYVQVTGADGRRVLDLPAETYTSGLQQIAVDTRRLPAGIYLVHLQANGVKEVKKLIVQR